MRLKYIKINSILYLYTLISDDTGIRVEVRAQEMLRTGNEEVLFKEYITLDQSKDIENFLRLRLAEMKNA